MGQAICGTANGGPGLMVAGLSPSGIARHRLEAGLTSKLWEIDGVLALID